MPAALATAPGSGKGRFQPVKSGVVTRLLLQRTEKEIAPADTVHYKIPFISQMENFFDNWTVQVRKGILEYCILTALGGGEQYGYALVKRLCSTPGLFVAEGSIYPLLSRMKAAGFVATRLEESPGGPARKYYQLTDAGRSQLARMKPYFAALTGAVQFLESQP
jgi:PadR family transcriptional regulator PadR